jgi:AraC-like DNA-binding protein
VEREIKGKCLFFQTPKDFHEIVTEERGGAYSVIISFSEQVIDKHLLHALTGEPIVLYALSDELVSKLEETCSVFDGQSTYKERHLKHLLNCILIDILEMGQPLTVVSDDIHPIVRESISYMLTNPAENITLDTFSQKFGISKTYFSHLFRDNAGISFKQYLVSLRMECAKRMLLENELPIIDVGFECGFFTPSQFVRSFKQHTGMTPSTYRASKKRT